MLFEIIFFQICSSFFFVFFESILFETNPNSVTRSNFFFYSFFSVYISFVLHFSPLCQDRVPVVFHDFELNISMKENNVRGINDHRSSEDQLIVGVHQLNWRQLSRAKTEFKSKHPSKLRELIKRHFEKILSMTPNGKRTRTSVVL